MVRKCIVCRKTKTRHPHLTFHGFPTLDEEKKNQWWKLLGFHKNKVVTKWREICSDHFLPGDLETKPSGIKHLRKNVLPQPYYNELVQETLDIVDNVGNGKSSEASAEKSPPMGEQPINMLYGILLGKEIVHEKVALRSVTVCPNNYLPENCILPNGMKFMKLQSPLTMFATESGGNLNFVSVKPAATNVLQENLDGSSASKQINDFEIYSSGSSEISSSDSSEITSSDSSSTTSALEPERVLKDFDVASPPKNQRRLVYFGDCRIEDLDFPHRANRVWEIAEETVTFQNDKIKSLETTKVKLESQVKRLSLVLKRLEKKFKNAKEEHEERANKKKLCQVCGEVFTDPISFRKHLRVHQVTCSYCDKNCREHSALKLHIRTHTGEAPYHCRYCPRTFKQPQHLQIHTRTHTGERPCLCPHCGKTFTATSILNSHIKYIHGIHSSGIRSRTTKRPSRPYKCNYCNKVFVSKQQLIPHKLYRHRDKEDECPFCNEILKPGKTKNSHIMNHILNKDQNSESENFEYYQCTTCKKVFFSKTSFAYHKLIHENKREFLCVTCGRGFNTKYLLLNHMKTHTGNKPFPCSLCGSSFAHINTLNVHMNMHTGRRPYKCEICEKGFKQPPHLKSHMRMHTGEKPYTCLYCKKSFAQVGTLRVHERLHTGERPYVCDICSKGFSHSSAMTKHRKTHKKPSLKKKLKTNDSS